MRQLILLLAAIGGTTYASTGSDQIPTPVNVVAETGRDIGPCPNGGSLRYPSAPFKGTAYFLLRADAAMATRHAEITKRQAPWLTRLDGPSSSNRLYVQDHAPAVLLYRVCRPGMCGADSAYGAYSTATGAYVIELTVDGKTESLGTDSAPLKAAIACAHSIDAQGREASTQVVRPAIGK